MSEFGLQLGLLGKGDEPDPMNVCIFSENRLHRYVLKHIWDEDKPVCMFVGLNPSTADEISHDNTVRRCVNFAKDWGYGTLIMTNIFGYRATDPKDMKEFSMPIGVSNDYHLLDMAESVALVIAAWGTHAEHMNRHKEVMNLFVDHNLYCLGVTKAGYPKHPLYLKSDLRPVLYKAKGQKIHMGDYVPQLAKKWGYEPERRHETIAGSKPISDSQLACCKNLWASNQEDGNELIQIIGYSWGMPCNPEGMSNWTMADAMFFINAIKGTAK